MIERVCLLEPLLAQPADNLKIGDYGGASVRTNLDGIVDVVDVTVRDQDVIGFDRVDLDLASGFGVMNGSKRRVLPPNWTEKQEWP